LVGLSGSSAICTAMFKSLLKFYEVGCPKELIPTLCWQAELEELGIQCGLQDRVIQVYNGLVFMDFDQKLFEANRHGAYVPLATSLLPNLYMAYAPQRAEVSGIYHRKLRVLFEEGKKDILAAMSEFADFAQQGYHALVAGKPEKLPELINANFDLRDRIFNVSDENRLMVHEARQAGASAKFAGSGGAIVGTFEDDDMFARLVQRMRAINCHVVRPEIAPTHLSEVPVF
jgi:glucuronokinase